ncbi:hypothetical protein DFQ28_001494, partial [Apophysomyces sp. BC1034]
SIKTLKKLKAFGAQTVRTTVILSGIYIDNHLKFMYKEPRKAVISPGTKDSSINYRVGTSLSYTTVPNK